MAKDLNCPNCLNPVDFWTFLKAPTPFHLRCGKCNEKLIPGSKGLSWFVVIAALVTASIIVASGIFYELHILLYLTFILICGLLFEVIVFNLIKGLGLNIVLSRK